MTWQFTLTGLLIGALVGLTGMGGGSLMTPILVIVFGFKPTYAVGTDILHGAIFKSFGAVRHRRLGTVKAKLALWMFIGSGPMSLLGVAAASALSRRYGDGVETAEGYAVGAALVAGAIGLAIRSFVHTKERPPDWAFRLDRRGKIWAVLIGAVFGFVVGLTSVGSGTFFGLVMVMVYPLSVSAIVGTDIFHAAALLWVAGAGHLVAGNVDMSAVGWLVIGSVPGVLIASQFTLRMPERVLRVALASVLLLSGIKLLDFPQGDAVLAAAACGVAIGFGAWALAVRAARRRPRQALSRPAGTD
ncbi:MAG: sulfite exporter TauE/SafE family protein [Gaiellaceae bacterium]